MVKALGRNDSLKLFSSHAFGMTMPPERFRELSASFVTYADGLPVALTLLGRSLYSRNNVSLWKLELEQVLERPQGDIQKILQRSCDALDENEKAIFLNIACFFVGEDIYEAFHLFKSRNYFPQVSIPILVERCLLTVDRKNKFQMHNLIQVMGRELAKSRKHLLLKGKERYLAVQKYK